MTERLHRAANVVAFQGELGAFSHVAAKRLLGDEWRVLACSSFQEVFAALRLRRVQAAVVPIENTLHGSIHENYDNLVNCKEAVVGEIKERIAHQLITMPGVSFGSIREVYSHPVALNQCRSFFTANPQLQQVSFYDTAGSVKMLSQEHRKGAAAIASAEAAQLYGGKIRRRNIEDDPKNFTRFFLLSKQAVELPNATGDWKTSVVFTAPNRPGSLFKALACFALRDVSLTKIESRPLKGRPWEYLFYLDLAGSIDSIPVRNAMQNLAELTDWVKVLGSYRPTP
jgi:prephenate dehydratase